MFRPDIFYRNSGLMLQFLASFRLCLKFMNKIRQTKMMSSETAANWWPNLWPLYLIHLHEQKWDQCEWIYLWMITIQIWCFFLSFRNSSQLPQPVTTPHPLFPVQVNLKYIWIILSFELFLFLEFGVNLKVCHTIEFYSIMWKKGVNLKYSWETLSSNEKKR